MMEINGVQEENRTIPNEDEGARLVVFRKGYLHNLFETEVYKLLKSENLRDYFSDEVINVFLT